MGHFKKNPANYRKTPVYYNLGLIVVVQSLWYCSQHSHFWYLRTRQHAYQWAAWWQTVGSIFWGRTLVCLCLSWTSLSSCCSLGCSDLGLQSTGGAARGTEVLVILTQCRANGRFCIGYTPLSPSTALTRESVCSFWWVFKKDNLINNFTVRLLLFQNKRRLLVFLALSDFFFSDAVLSNLSIWLGLGLDWEQQWCESKTQL